MAVFIDTSALLALLDRDDLHHKTAAAIWRRLLHESSSLVSSNYIVIETAALTQRRLGMAALRAVVEDILPVLELIWVDKATHERAVEALLEKNRRKVSLVDCTSFEVMRLQGCTQVFCFDRHFAEEGFEKLTQ